MLRYLSLLLFLHLVLIAKSQSSGQPNKWDTGNPDTLQSANDNYIEEYSSRFESYLDFSDFQVTDLFSEKYKVNINKATDRSLKRLGLNDQQIIYLRKYMQEYGEISSLYELNLVEGFDSALIVKMSPSIYFKLDTEIHKLILKDLRKRSVNSIIAMYSRNLEYSRGYISREEDSLPPAFAGNPDKLLLKYSYRYYDRLKWGFTLEKDPGESMKNGFDFSSFYFYYGSKGLIKSLAVGSYNLSFAQGLNMNTGFRLYAIPAKGLIPLMQNKLSANSSSNEEQGLRGLAFTLKPVNSLNITLFYSNRLKDALVTKADSLNTYDDYFTSLSETGLHRSQSELAKKDALAMKTTGGNFQFRSGSFRLGGTIFNTDFSEVMIPLQQKYDPYKFKGCNLLNYGFDGAFMKEWITAYLEYSKGSVGGDAWISGIKLQSSQEYGLTLTYRRYSPDYNNFYSNSFSSSTSRNESGIYAGLFTNLSKKLSILASSDQYRRPWLSYRADFPSRGSEYMVQLTYAINRTDMCRVMYRMNKSLINNSDQIALPLESIKQNIRFDLKLHPHQTVTIKNRIELVKADLSSVSKMGFLMYQDMTFVLDKQPVSINLRYTLFDIDDYDARIYSYESDVLYSYSVPSFFMKGSRYSVMVQYKHSRTISVWIRYAATYYPEALNIGSGLDEISGNTKSELKLQFILKL